MYSRAQTHYDSLLARFRLLQGGLVSFIDDVLADDASDALFDLTRSEALAKKGKKAAASVRPSLRWKQDSRADADLCWPRSPSICGSIYDPTAEKQKMAKVGHSSSRS